MNVKLISYILRAKNRRNVLTLLTKETLTPAQIMKRTKMYESHVSRTLKELQQKKLIVCKNPEDRRYKFYKTTEIGRKIEKEQEKILEEIKKS